MASHSGTEHSTALHVMAWHRVPWRVSGSSSRGLGRSGVAAPCPAPWAPRKPPHEAGLMESTHWLCFQHRLLKAETGLPPDTSSKRRRPKEGGASAAQKSTNRHRMCNHFRCFFGRGGGVVEGESGSATYYGTRFFVLWTPPQRYRSVCFGDPDPSSRAI